MPQQP
ncbi:hypothetical protein YPPY34_4563, partial [Yersinia pestis PY-34]